MKNLLAIICFLCTPIFILGQNLILNPSLEEHWDCPYGGVSTFSMAKNCYSPSSPPGQPFVDPWLELNNPATPDYFHTCATSEYTIPNSDIGYQNPKDGNAFGGFYLLFSYNECLKEYATFTIASPLTEGKEYCFSFYVSLANRTPYAIDNIGAYFTVDSAYINTPCLEIVPQIQSPDGVFMGDTSDNWMQISGSFIAAGGEKYVTLGNFNTDENTDYIQTYPTSMGPGAYYLFDMLSLELCNASDINVHKITNISIYPNPVTNTVSISLPANYSNPQLYIYNHTGQLVATKPVQPNQTVPITELSPGIYIFAIQSNNTLIGREKVVVY